MSWTLNGTPIVKGTLQHPAAGTWTARLETTHDEAPSGSALLELPGLSLQGAVVSSGVFGGRCTVRLVGGAGKLATRIPGQHFQQGATGRLVAESILGAAGEVLDTTSAGLDGPLSSYAYFAGPASRALGQLARVLGLDWWVTSAGLIRLGTLDYPAATPDGLVLDVLADRRVLIVAPEEAPAPNTTYQGVRVLAVDHAITGTRWRAEVRY